MHRLWYFTREALKNFRHSLFPTLASMGTIAISLVLFWVLNLLLSHGGKLEHHVNQNLAIFIYLKSEATTKQLAGLSQTLSGWKDVRRVRIIGPEEAKKESRKLLTPQEAKGLKLDDIPALPYLEVHLTGDQRTRDDYDRIRNQLDLLKKQSVVHSVAYGEKEVRLIRAVMDIGSFLGWTICIIILLAAVYFTFSTIQLAVYARSEEIAILKLIGATNSFIRMPFYLEGLIQGFVGAVIAMILIVVVESRFMSYISETHHLQSSIQLVGPLQLALVLGAGITLGLAGSFLSTRRYLRV